MVPDQTSGFRPPQLRKKLSSIFCSSEFGFGGGGWKSIVEGINSSNGDNSRSLLRVVRESGDHERSREGFAPRERG